MAYLKKPKLSTFDSHNELRQKFYQNANAHTGLDTCMNDLGEYGQE